MIGLKELTMDDSNRQMARHSDTLGVNKMGKNIKKSPIHQPNFSNANLGSRPQPQSQVYNINKNDFRSIVQQLTGSPLHEPAPRPPQNPPKPQSTRLQKIKPPPLMPVNRPRIPIHPPAPAQPSTAAPYNNNFVRPPPQYGQPPSTATDIWSNTAESPISAYMRYLQTSFVESGPKQMQMQDPRLQPQGPVHTQTHPQQSGLLPNPPVPSVLSPRYGPLQSPRMNAPPPFPSPRINGPPPPFPSPGVNGPPPPFPSPGINGPPLLPSPTSQFLLPSPTGFSNLLSPHSPYPLLSPGIQHPPPLSPNFSFSSQSGILGPAPHPPPSPGYGFPFSPSGFFPITSPRWRPQ